jgi:hypothetical protein
MDRSLPTPPDRGESDDEHQSILRFCNKSLKTLQVIWVNYDGREVQYATLKPGDSYGQGKPGCYE